MAKFLHPITAEGPVVHQVDPEPLVVGGQHDGVEVPGQNEV